MNTLQKIILLFAVFLVKHSKAQAPCTASNSPTFQLVLTQATLATNGFCGAQIYVNNAQAAGGGAASYCIMAPGQTTMVPPPCNLSGIAMTSGIWTVEVKDNLTSCVTTQTVQVTVLPAPTISITASDTLFCSGRTATLTASGASTYTWNTNATTGSIFIMPTTSTYSVTGTGSNGCANTSAFVVNVKPSPIMIITVSQQTVCEQESVQLTAQGADTYTWSTFQPGPVITVTPAATTIYTVSGTNAEGCKSQKQISITVSPCTAIDELKTVSEAFVIYPSPAKDVVAITITGTELSNDVRAILIYDHCGQLVRKEECIPGNKTLEVQIHELPEGIYFLKVLSSENESQGKRLLITR